MLAGVLGAGIARMWERGKREGASRTFEKNRIAALERGLDLKGEATSTAIPGELTGTVLGGKYRIGKKIGSGGIGVVYAAEHTTLGHEVAVKVLRGAAAKDGGEIARLRREAYIQVHIDHPNVARVHDLDQMPDGSMYVVMERLHGRSLADKLSREHIIAPGFAIPVLHRRVSRARRRAQEGRRASRPEAGQRLPLRGRAAQGPRFRHEQAHERRVAHAGRLHAGHARVHGARAVHRRERRRRRPISTRSACSCTKR